MDGRTTLVHYLAALMAESEPQALQLGRRGGECGAVSGAQHWTFAELEKQVGPNEQQAGGGVAPSRQQPLCRPRSAHPAAAPLTPSRLCPSCLPRLCTGHNTAGGRHL